VTFTDSSQGDNLAYAWDFDGDYAWDFDGDGVVDSDQPAPAPFTYEQPGTYNATLTVSNSVGSDSISQQIVANAAVAAPVAQFTADPTSGDAPLTVTFTDSSQGDNLAYAWDFDGDGVVDSDQPAPAPFTYEQPGTYNATLMVSNSVGSDTISQEIVVNEVTVQPDPITGVLLFVSDREGNFEIYAANADGSGAENITNNPTLDTDPVWSPDGSQIAFVSNRDGSEDIYIMNVNDRSITRLTNNPAVDMQPAWSPDGSQIAFVSNRAGDNDIWVVSAQGGEPTQRTFDVTNDRYPTWSPDGTQIAYVTDANGNDDIYIINANDGTFISQATTDVENDRFPDWSADGIVFSSWRDGQNELYVTTLNGNPPVRLTDNAANDRFPRWTPDGRIVYSSDLAPDGSGNIADENIYIINSDGSGVTPLTTNTSTERIPALRAE
jgi:PKD repeat protein